MKSSPGTDAFNVVLVGAWNAAIFSPEWAKQNLAVNKEQEVVLAIPMQMALAPRLTVEGINLYPSAQALVLDCVEYSDAALQACALKVERLAALLPHTPVSAVGVNFRFVGALEDHLALADLFAFSDAAKIDAGAFTLSSSVVKRSYMLKDSSILNLTIESRGGRLGIEFNFHSDIKSLAEAPAKTTYARILDYRAQAGEFMNSVYDVQVEA